MPNIEQLKKVKDIIDRHTNPQEHMMKRMEQMMAEKKPAPEKKSSPGISLHLQNALTLKGDKGDSGDIGKDGKTPQRGVDYFTPQDIEVFAKHILAEATPKPGVHYKTGTDGKNGLKGDRGEKGYSGDRGERGFRGEPGRDGKNADMNVIVQKVINQLKKDEKPATETGITAQDVIAEIRKTKALDISEIRNANPYMGKKLEKLDMSDLRWHGGGLQPNQIYVETPSGAVNGINLTYTVANTITTVINFSINGQFIHPTDYTFSGKTITFSVVLPGALSGLPFTIAYA